MFDPMISAILAGCAVIVVLVWLPIRESFKLYDELQFNRKINKRERMARANRGLEGR